jgi:hypothetical protein
LRGRLRPGRSNRDKGFSALEEVAIFRDPLKSEMNLIDFNVM